MAKHILNLHAPFIESVSNTEEIQKRLPDDRMDPYLQYAEEQRVRDKEIGQLGEMHKQIGWTHGRTMKRIAVGIPMPILAAIRRVDPEFGRGTGAGRARFYRWLKDHPEWALGERVDVQ